MAGILRDKTFWFVAGCYTVARLLLVVNTEAVTSPDTPGYRTISFIGASDRPWVAPLLLYAWMPDELIVLVQTTFSAVAFVVLAATVAVTVADWRVRVALMSAVLLYGLSARVVWWDPALLSESLAISFTALLISAGVWLVRSPGTGTRAAFLAIFVGWVFVRDAHAILAPVVVVAALMWARPRRHWFFAMTVCVVAAWGLAASRNNQYIEEFNVTTHVAYRIAPAADRLQWFQDSGMPDVPALQLRYPGERLQGLWADNEFRAWATADGVNTYVRFVATHPSYAAEALTSVLFDLEGDGVDTAMVDNTRYPKVEPPTVQTIWPNDGQALAIGLVIAGAWLVWRNRARWQAFSWPIGLAVTAVPHAFVVYHGSGMELNRHAVVLSFVLLTSLAWLVAVGVDVELDRQSPLVGEVRFDLADLGGVERSVVDGDFSDSAVERLKVARPHQVANRAHVKGERVGR